MNLLKQRNTHTALLPAEMVNAEVEALPPPMSAIPGVSRIAQLGETATEGTIISWRRAVGDSVARGDELFEIETDKTTMEVPATSDGSITEIRVPAWCGADDGSDAARIGEEFVATKDGCEINNKECISPARSGSDQICRS